jgi:nitrogen fixation protein NifU and related proteins
LDKPFAELDDLYRDVVLDHYRSPRGRDPLPAPDVRQEGFNPICGDEVHVAIEMDNGSIRGCQVCSRGCAISVASGSMLAELLPGRSCEDCERLSEAFRAMLHGEAPPKDLDMGDLEALHGVAKFPVRIKCAMLPWTTLKAALRAYAGKKCASCPVLASTDESDSVGTIIRTESEDARNAGAPASGWPPAKEPGSTGEERPA